eukprot:Hpha_TRINITY_DN10330_c0_g2::TRINITY_DN10330_c0_g2_i2::g.116092::m.116092
MGLAAGDGAQGALLTRWGAAEQQCSALLVRVEAAQNAQAERASRAAEASSSSKPASSSRGLPPAVAAVRERLEAQQRRREALDVFAGRDFTADSGSPFALSLTAQVHHPSADPLSGPPPPRTPARPPAASGVVDRAARAHEEELVEWDSSERQSLSRLAAELTALAGGSEAEAQARLRAAAEDIAPLPAEVEDAL